MLIATAGHIDHGKTSLVRALTAVETDRLPEEKARGISIDLGFAYWRTPEGGTIGFVDVPGHERFIRNMLAGVSGVDAALLVVAADDGVMPQTVEHVQIVDLLGVTRAFVALTKCDRVEPERIAAVRAEVAALLAPTGLAQAATFDVSATTGIGVAELGQALRQAAAAPASTFDGSRNFRLGIDRAFTVSGVGTVVTGTVLDGAVETGARLMLAPRGTEVRVRGLQNAGERVARVEAGERCALNLAGVQLEEVGRGDWLVVPEMRAPTQRLDVELHLLDTRDEPLRHYTPVHLHLATADITARVLVPAQGIVTPGTRAMVQLVLDAPAIAVNGDRLVLRDQSDRLLLGGGRVVDPLASAGRRRAQAQASATAALRTYDPAAALAAMLAEGQEVDTLAFARRFNLQPAAAQALFEAGGAVLLGRSPVLALPQERVRAIGDEVLALLAAFHEAHPELAGMPVRDLRTRLATRISAVAFAALLRELVEQQRVAFAGALVRLHGHAASFTAAEQALWTGLREWLEDRGPLPFTAADAAAEARTGEANARAMLYRRRANGDVLRMDDRRFLLREHAAALGRLAAALVARGGGEGFTAAQFRDASGLGRNVVIVLLEFLDTLGVTSRHGATRTVGRDFAAVVGDAAAEPADRLPTA